MNGTIRKNRRGFLKVITLAGTGGVVTDFRALGAEKAEKPAEPNEVSLGEDLMREHGVLSRVLLVYEEALIRLDAPKPDVKPEVLSDAAGIIRRFIEDYHEKLEEDHLFPRFEKAGKEVDLVRVLRQQHQAGRRGTDQILQLAKLAAMKDPNERLQLTTALRQFIRMYRPHESREDTVLFPALHSIITPHEYDALGEDFEKREHQLLGDDGFERMVDKVAGLEKAIGIYDLAQFTPKPEDQHENANHIHQ